MRSPGAKVKSYTGSDALVVRRTLRREFAVDGRGVHASLLEHLAVQHAHDAAAVGALPGLALEVAVDLFPGGTNPVPEGLEPLAGGLLAGGEAVGHHDSCAFSGTPALLRQD
jgi:hypothetical protein